MRTCVASVPAPNEMPSARSGRRPCCGHGEDPVRLPAPPLNVEWEHDPGQYDEVISDLIVDSPDFAVTAIAIEGAPAPTLLESFHRRQPTRGGARGRGGVRWAAARIRQPALRQARSLARWSWSPIPVEPPAASSEAQRDLGLYPLGIEPITLEPLGNGLHRDDRARPPCQLHETLPRPIGFASRYSIRPNQGDTPS